MYQYSVNINYGKNTVLIQIIVIKINGFFKKSIHLIQKMGPLFFFSNCYFTEKAYSTTKIKSQKVNRQPTYFSAEPKSHSVYIVILT